MTTFSKSRTADLALCASITLTLSLSAACGGSAATEADEPSPNTPDEIVVTKVTGATFVQPESVRWDDEAEVWYVTNMGEPLGEPNQPGWLTRLDASGAVLDDRWVEGLSSPTGMAILERRLYVADGQQLVVVDIAAAEIVDTIAFPDAGFINDVTATDDAIYVSDSLGNAIYRVVPGQAPEMIIQDTGLGIPNGILVRGAQIIVAGFGPFPQDDPELTQPGPMSTIAIDSGERSRLGSLEGKLDGLEADGEDLLVTDIRGQLIRLTPDGEHEVVIDLSDDLQSAADHGFDPDSRTVMIPDLFNNQVAFFQIR
ncbi:MAG: hypothetical protein AAGC55_02480 [Myxococcota bacterium]